MPSLLHHAALAAALSFGLMAHTHGVAAAPLPSAAMAKPVVASAAVVVDQVQWRRGRGRGGGLGFGIGAGILGGAILGQVLRGPDYYYSSPRAYYYRPAPVYAEPRVYYAPAPVYAAPRAYDDSVSYCLSRFRSYDPASGTYLGYDGYRHPCP